MTPIRDKVNNLNKFIYFQKLSACYSEHRKRNESRNKTAVNVAYKIFCNTMDEACGGFRLKKADLRKQLTAAVMKGKTEFMQKRFHKEYNIFVADPYLNLLEEVGTYVDCWRESTAR